MGLLAEIRKFIGKWIKNPLVLAGISYLIYKILVNKVSKESLEMKEDIKVLHKDGQFEVILDTITNSYALINGNDVIPAKDVQDAKNKIQKLKMKKNSYTKGDEIGVNEGVNMSERINKLYESVCKEALSKIPFVDKETAKDAAEILMQHKIKSMVMNAEILVDNNDKEKAKQILRQQGMKGL